MRLLVVTAVAVERDCAARGLHTLGDAHEYGVPGARLLRLGPPSRRRQADRAGARQDSGAHGLPAPEGRPDAVADLLAAGAGPGASAAGTAAALTAAALRGEAYDLVVSAGIGGGFVPLAPIGSVVVADSIVAADLGADSPAGFLPVADLGFGTSVHHPPQPLAARAARALGAVHGPVLTVSTVTGTAEGARELAARHPGAAAEAMEGFGVAEAGAAHGVPVIEIRAVSNPVGPRDRAAWRIPDALDALAAAFTRLIPVLGTEPVRGRETAGSKRKERGGQPGRGGHGRRDDPDSSDRRQERYG